MSTADPSSTQVMPAADAAARKIRLERIELDILLGPDAGREVKLTLPSVKIGTASDNEVMLTDRTVSRHHAEIRMTQEGLLLSDLGSTNGTFLNGLRVKEAYLGAESVLALGSTEIRIGAGTEERPYEVARETQLGGLVGGTEPMRELYGLIKVVAPTPTTVLITGESGSGKEVVATTLHERSGRRGPLVVFDASVTDPEMVRNDLFGHIKGAFTGATGAREGAFRRADGGTLFIDEIGELPLELQPRLLRVLESREVSPVGSDQPVKVDVRVVAATHRNLEAMVQAGEFRADLYYRLSVICLRVPPLREIKADIPLLVQSFADKMGMSSRLTEDAERALLEYHWPGNVRELRNVLERAAVLCRSQEIRPEHLRLMDLGAASRPSTMGDTSAGSSAAVAQSPGELKAMERQMISDAMARNRNNKTAVARELGIPLSTLKRRITEYGL
ncbi:sigma 54-dependent Fis family transcriptional regulator [Thiorhodococcus mannitoliphagus]|uniref:Sigma 54-dependent Fis family transcriptional regulator n=1 Tax=Thiorhodococcus mannitoliphagus TaxID=329406 RepID=A0A6P1DNR4_9GAMM|nr:sigma 54-interacting transcriptional regulator [Thiorhodococcus mannitoliphagus]NEX19180.1 sigma 54-dependent Fis family transcriptional regulator [Thiorhodococcus mannitoliphagus]